MSQATFSPPSLGLILSSSFVDYSMERENVEEHTVSHMETDFNFILDPALLSGSPLNFELNPVFTTTAPALLQSNKQIRAGGGNSPLQVMYSGAMKTPFS